MDLTNLRQHHEELVNHMKNSGYSMSCIYMYKRQIREILELDLESWTSYQDIYQYFVSISSNQKDLKWRRSVIGSIEYFDIYGLFPDRRRICSFIEPRGAYHSLNHVYQQLIYEIFDIINSAASINTLLHCNFEKGLNQLKPLYLLGLF